MPDKVVSRENLKAFREKIDDKYVIEGEYSPSTSVGLADEADNLTPYGDNSGASDQSAFRFQTTGGSSDVGALAYCKKLLGNTVGFNQLVQNGNFESDSGWYCANGTLSVTNHILTITKSSNSSFTLYRANSEYNLSYNHYYLVKVTVKASASCKVRTRLLNVYGDKVTLTANTTQNIANILKPTSSGSFAVALTDDEILLSTNDTIQVSNFQLIDLTLLGKEYTSVVDFNRDYPLPYYSYNAGQLFSCKTNKVRNVGYNAFDGEIEGGYIDEGTGIPYDNVNSFRSKNYIDVIAGETYTLEHSNFTTVAFYIFQYDGNKNFIKSTWITSSGNLTGNKTLENNTRYVKFAVYGSGSGWGDNPPTQAQAQIAFHLTWDGSRTGFEQYQVNEYAMPNIELKGGWDGSGNHWGDELTPDGTLTNGCGVMEFDGSTGKGIDTTKGTSGVFQTFGSYTQFYLQQDQFISPADHSSDEFYHYAIGNIMIQKINVENTGVVMHNHSNVTWILLTLPTSIASTGTQANAWLSNNKVTVYYDKIATTEQDDDYKYQEVTPIDDFGTQQALSSITESASTPIVPQGFDFFYPVDYKAFIDSVGGREDIEYDASQLVSQTQLGTFDTKHDNLYAIIQENIGGTLRHQLVANVVAGGGTLDFNNTAWVDLGTINWNYDSVNSRFISSSAITGIKSVSSAGDVPTILSPLYKTIDMNHQSSNMTISQYTNGNLYIKNSSYTDATAFKNAMKGILLAYEKAS